MAAFISLFYLLVCIYIIVNGILNQITQRLIDGYKSSWNRLMPSKEFRPDDASALARLFSTKVISELAQNHYSTLFFDLLNASGLTNIIEARTTVKDVFEFAFSVLRKRDYRHEYIYKAALFEKVQLGHHSLNTACMINEIRVGKSKADTVLFNGNATAYEIKSERDSLSRLGNQISDYYQVFPLVNVIAGENHIPALEHIFPEKMGILTLTRRYTITTVRSASADYSNLDHQKILNCIRISEAKSILTKIGICIPDVPNTRIYDEISLLFDQIDLKLLHMTMVHTLKKSRSLASLGEYLAEIPTPLKSVVVSAKLRNSDKLKLLNVLNTPINKLKV